MDPNQPVRFAVYPNMLDQQYMHHFRNDNSKIRVAKKAGMDMLKQQFGVTEANHTVPSGYVFDAPNMETVENIKKYFSDIHNKIVPGSDPQWEGKTFISILSTAWPNGIKVIGRA